MNLVESVRVELGDRAYRIELGGGTKVLGLAELLGGRRFFTLSDETVAGLYLKEMTAGLTGSLGSHAVPAGESSKCQEIATDIYTRLIHAGADRKTVLIALGGGVVGDLAGFVAASFMRGLPYIQIPTTLLAMVDSSVGGKTAINHALGKNLIGFFHQPEGVLVALGVLHTLPDRELSAGLAEVIKYGIIRDAEFFAWLEDKAPALLARDEEALARAIAVSVRIKADVVAGDERELTGLRAILNLGHTFAHAEEVLSGYGEVLHGEAVAAGMIAACRCAEKLGRLSDRETGRVEALIRACRLPTRLRAAANREDFWKAMTGDKKSESGSIKFVIPAALGRTGKPEALERALVDSVLDELSGV
ncbi:MAG: 3-dehydroquinate synthase [Planctomycetes bacterium]|nr:3-dehydroquinate synthase [Planctomycetota bacterium]